jgi:hydroxyacylglutathione hydrolase
MSKTLEQSGSPTPGGWFELDPATASGRLAELALIDVREPDEYTGPLGHVAGARLVPLATVPTALADLDRSKAYLVICKSGGRSGRAAAWMRQAGFERVFNLTGGMTAWNGGGLPVAG